MSLVAGPFYKFLERSMAIGVLQFGNTFLSRYWSSKSQIVLILQMGKVSSSSLYATLKQQKDIATFQFHRVRPIRRQQFSGGPIRRLLLAIRSSLHEATGFVVNSKIENFDLPVKFIVTVREPIGRNVSAYFHNRVRFSYLETAEKGDVLERVEEIFLRCYPHDLSLSWFDTQLQPLTGVDVYSQPFDQERGHCTLKSERGEILLMHHDLPEADMLSAVNEFLGIELTEIVRTNLGGEKRYASEYTEFLSSAKLPKGYVLDMLNSKYAKHFYDLEYRREVANRWVAGGVKPDDLH